MRSKNRTLSFFNFQLFIFHRTSWTKFGVCQRACDDDRKRCNRSIRATIDLIFAYTKGARDAEEELNSHQPVTSVTPITKSVRQAMAEFPFSLLLPQLPAPDFSIVRPPPSPNFPIYNIPTNNLNNLYDYLETSNSMKF